MPKLLKLSALLLAAFLVGCSGKTKTEATPKTGDDGKTAAAPAPAMPATPEETAKHVTTQLGDGKPEVLWDALPASYQSDATGLVHEFGKTVDQETYNAGFGLVQKVVKILETKKEFILALPNLQQNPAKPELEKNWDKLVGFVSKIANCELTDSTKLASLDVRQFLATTGSSIMKDAMALALLAPQKPNEARIDPQIMFRNTKAEVLNKTADSATLKVTAPGEKPEELQVVKVEDKWIPKEMADGWKQGVLDAKAALAKMKAETNKKNKDMVLAQIKQVDAMLDQVLATKTADEFTGQIGQIIGMAMGAIMGGMGGMGGPDGGGMQGGMGQ